LSSPTALTIMSLQINVWIIVSGTTSVVPLTAYYYSIDVVLPQTDTLNNAALFGTLYSPYFSSVSSCSNSMNLINTPGLNQPIIITNITATAVAFAFLADLSFNVKFYLTRADILSSSEIDILFTNAVTSSITTCSLWSPQNYVFLEEILTASGVRLKPLAYDTPFTFTAYQITCKNVLIQQNSIGVNVKWLDGANVLQQPSANANITSLPTATSIPGSLLSKNFNSLGYDSQFTFSLTLSTNGNDNVEIWVDVSGN
jgi:hypothetical protein